MAVNAPILGFDTSAAHCAAAVILGETLLSVRVEPMDKGQAERLMPLLEEVLADAGAGWRDLAAIGVGTGPGNFTGVRISVAAARGLALGLGIPAIGVTGFDALALDLPFGVATALDARRDAFWLSAPGVSAQIATLDTLPDGLRGRDVTGHRASEIALRTGGRAVSALFPAPVAIARLAAARYDVPQPRPAPLYLRGADAAPPSDPPPVILP
jgi:tRNA threonylcarbamoyl adenosine modification protein YeaZ